MRHSVLSTVNIIEIKIRRPEIGKDNVGYN